MILPKVQSPYKWWGFSLFFAAISVYFGYHLRDVFSGIVYDRGFTNSGKSFTWAESPWWFGSQTGFMILLSGLSAYLSVLTAIAGFSLFRLKRDLADLETDIADADRAVAQAETATPVSSQGETDRLLAEADRAIAEADQVLRSLDHEALAQETKPPSGTDGPRIDKT